MPRTSLYVHALMSIEDFYITDYEPPKDLQEGYMGLCRVLRLFPGGRNCDLGYYEWKILESTTKSLMSLGPSTRRSGWIQTVFGDNIWYKLRHLKPHDHSCGNDIACLDDQIETTWMHSLENEVDIIEISDDEVDIEISDDE